MERLVEETEAHILVGLLLLLLLLLLGLLLGSGSTTGGGGSSGTSTARGNGSELLRASGDQLERNLSVDCAANRGFSKHRVKKAYLVDVLARELGDELLETLILGLDADGAEDGLDVLGRGGGVAAEGEEEVGCEVLHFEGSANEELR
jgi:hypothetical protein